MVIGGKLSVVIKVIQLLIFLENLLVSINEKNNDDCSSNGTVVVARNNFASKKHFLINLNNIT